MKNIDFKFENTYINLSENLFSKESPDRVPNPKLILFNNELADFLGIDLEFFKSNYGIQILSGNTILNDSVPIAQAYAGHQFGHFTILGDGRAVLLGEIVSSKGERFDIQLKGSGRTKYSRGGDGKATLGPMLREYIISEGMNALGIPTTRSLAVVATGEWILREGKLPGAILTRVAKSHIRVGTFQYIANFGDVNDLKELVNYTLERHFKSTDYGENQYLYLLNEVIRKQAELIAKWQLVGFIHGVMNTDNMTISGETIDYGPCAFMDTYNTKTVFSSIDTYGRYSYENQPNIGAWNLARFAEALLPLLNDDKNEAIKVAEDAISNYFILYKSNWYCGMRKKLGLLKEEKVDEYLIETLLAIMEKYEADYTNTFVALTLGDFNTMKFFHTDDFKKWNVLWNERLLKEDSSKNEIRKLMEMNNPIVIPRNYRVEEALNKATKENDIKLVEKLLDAITSPYDYSKINEFYCKSPEKTDINYKTYCGT